ncbi:MAG: DUF2272 domain-containing protein [Paucibacter sp.]|nr:DUF2272 domain-containing protein [Roseateles sp.]
MKKLLASLLLLAFGGAQAQSCEQPGPPSELGQRLADIAMGEYRQFNGHRIDAQGRLWKFGNVEVEAEPLRDAEPADRYAWRRVWRYWETLDKHVPGTLDMRRVSWASDLLDDSANAGRSRLSTLREIFAKLPADMDPAELEVLRESVVRATISDTPWSAAFISYLMDRAGLSEEQFHFASAHAVYIRPALEGKEGYAYRACDVRKTAPRVGDLICYGRAARPLRSFADWQAQMGALDGSVKSHCDLVVKVDRKAAKMESMGGNVEQSVTWRKLMLDERGMLSTRHLSALHDKPFGPNAAACADDASCLKSDLNLQYWGVLLQLR